ncbi:MAG: hypothetical protein V1791_10820 [Pseudomonadota bacterium]
MKQPGTFPEGLMVDGSAYRIYTLDEQKFRHTLEVMNDPATGDKVEDPVWYSAALLAKRLEVEGLPCVTAEMVLDLSGPDGDELTHASIVIEQRRREFRSAAQAATEDPAGPVETGVQQDGD